MLKPQSLRTSMLHHDLDRKSSGLLLKLCWSFAICMRYLVEASFKCDQCTRCLGKSYGSRFVWLYFQPFFYYWFLLWYETTLCMISCSLWPQTCFCCEVFPELERNSATADSVVCRYQWASGRGMLPFSCWFVWNSLIGVSSIIIKLSNSIRFRSCFDSFIEYIFIKDYVFWGKGPFRDVTFYFISSDLPDFEVILIWNS